KLALAWPNSKEGCMSGILVLISAATLLTAAAVCGAGVAKGGPTMPLKLTSSAFSAGGTIPKKHTCDGADVSPPLAWSDAPSAAQSFALIADDPDAPVSTWVHWVLFDIPGKTRALPEGVAKQEELADG